jgi:hypothetical protein
MPAKNSAKFIDSQPLMFGNEQTSRSVLLFDVDRDPEIDAVIFDPRRSSVDDTEAVVQRRICLRRLDDRPSDQSA